MTENNKIDIKGLWRPMMGWMYLLVCITDFIIFPILWNLAQATYLKNLVFTQWNPLTLQGAGFFHIAMGAVLGISAYGRTQEKINGVNPTPSLTNGNNGVGMTASTVASSLPPLRRPSPSQPNPPVIGD
ncbi:hypothetical protein EBU71_00095 [bacterium]|nr:hypothetical protein [Candidatus Elulimicrobium humile]